MPGGRGGGAGGKEVDTRPIIGERWAAEGLRHWPYLGQKNAKIRTLFRTKPLILLPYLIGQRTLPLDSV